MILYFSGTGNSKYIANVLANELGERAVSANELIKRGEKIEAKNTKRLIFVSPVYAWRLPKIFQNFIKDCAFTGGAYFLLTCGDSICNAEKYLKKFCKSIGLEFMGASQIVMPENYIAMFTATPKEEISGLIAKAKISAEGIAQSIANGEKLPPVKTNLLGKFLSSFIVNGGFYTFCI